MHTRKSLVALFNMYKDADILTPSCTDEQIISALQAESKDIPYFISYAREVHWDSSAISFVENTLHVYVQGFCTTIKMEAPMHNRTDLISLINVYFAQKYERNMRRYEKSLQAKKEFDSLPKEIFIEHAQACEKVTQACKACQAFDRYDREAHYYNLKYHERISDSTPIPPVAFNGDPEYTRLYKAWEAARAAVPHCPTEPYLAPLPQRTESIPTSIDEESLYDILQDLSFEDFVTLAREYGFSEDEIKYERCIGSGYLTVRLEDFCETFDE